MRVVLPTRPRSLARGPLDRRRHGRLLRRPCNGCSGRSLLWNGEDPILKERISASPSGEGNHGEDVKEYWWYLDAPTTRSYLSGANTTRIPPFPTPTCSPTNGQRGKRDPDYELY